MLELFDDFGLQSYQEFLSCVIILYALGVKITPEFCNMSDI